MSKIQPRLGVIHATLVSTHAIQRYANEFLPDVEIVHFVDDTIHCMNVACGPGNIPHRNYVKFVQAAQSQHDYGVDLILLACSTFNRAVEYAQPMIPTRLLQIDRPMMELAVQRGTRIGLIATVATTIPSSERLLRVVAGERGREIKIETRLCSEAFQCLQKGQADRHNALLLDELDRLSATVDVIVLAQVSMSHLESQLVDTKVPVLTSGRTTFEYLRDYFATMPLNRKIP